MHVVLAPRGLEDLFVDAGNEVPVNNVPPPPMDTKQMKKLASILPKYGVQFTNL